jgi:EamA-like transporter family
MSDSNTSSHSKDLAYQRDLTSHGWRIASGCRGGGSPPGGGPLCCEARYSLGNRADHGQTARVSTVRAGPAMAAGVTVVLWASAFVAMRGAGRDFSPGALALGSAPIAGTLSVACLGVFPAAVAFTTWAYALSHTTVGKMCATTYVAPAITVLMSRAVLGEVPAWLAFAGGALCLAGGALCLAGGALCLAGGAFPQRRPKPARAVESGSVPAAG